MSFSLNKLSLALFITMIITHHAFKSQAAISCGSVANAMRPCINYLQRGGRSVPKTCCGGVRSVFYSVRTTHDRQTACRCLKSAAGFIRGIKLSAAVMLPRACRVHIPYGISPRTNCAKVR